jgi:hypothetical protein
MLFNRRKINKKAQSSTYSKLLSIYRRSFMTKAILLIKVTQAYLVFKRE